MQAMTDSSTHSSNGLYSVLKKFDALIDKIAIFGLVVAMWGMLILTLTTIFLRWFHITFLWVDPIVRHLVFLSGFLGGLLASGTKQHIAIDLVTRYLEGKNKTRSLRNVGRLVDGMCALTTLWLSWSSIQFVKDAFAFEGDAFLGVPTGVLVIIIPVGFLLMGYRFTFHFIRSFFEKNLIGSAHGHGGDQKIPHS